jgi:DNA-binding transcriptional LysR family regulator
MPSVGGEWRLDLTSLRYFFEAARTGSIRQAAEHVHVAPSAVSRQIAKLEHEFGSPLLERRSNGVRLTPAGELLARQLQLTIRDLAQVRGQIDDLKGLRRGEVTIYCIEGLVDSFLPSAIGRFNGRYAEITFNVVVASTDRILEALACDEADIGIALNSPARAPINVTAAWNEPVRVIVAPFHPLATRRSVSLRELAGYGATLPDSSFGVRRLVDRLLAAHGVSARLVVTTNSILMTTSIARQGIAYTLMPAFAVARDLETGALLAIPIADRDLEPARVEICTHLGRRLPVAASEFLSFLQGDPNATSGAPPAEPPRLKPRQSAA